MEPVRITLVPHTHWDREWYQPFDAFLERLVTMMDQLIDLLSSERGEGLHFHLDGQTAMIDDYLAVRPEREEALRALARDGRVSVGPWFTQADEFLVSGESLVRNLERGLARARDLAADPSLSPPGYLPDQFGHVGQMPQVLRGGGVGSAVVWRGVPSAVDRTPFQWEAPDGSAVVTEYLAWGYSLGMHLREKTEPQELAQALRNAVQLLTPFSLRPRFLLTVGSDHHGPDPSLAHRLRKARPHVPDLDAAVGSIASFVDGDEPEGMPAWRGELRSSARAHLLPGVYSTRVHQKQERGRIEALVERVAEPLAALVPGSRWPDQAFDRIWQLLLWNAAHDSACGCSVDEVAADVDARFAEARTLAEGVVRGAMDRFGGLVREAGTLVVNPSPFERDGVPALGWRVGEAPPGPASAELDGLDLSFTDEPDVGDLYNFCPAEDHRVATARPELDGDGGWVARFDDALEIRVRASALADGPMVLDLAIRNDRPDHRLRLVLPLPAPVEGAVAGSPFELVRRSLVSEGSDREAPSPTWPARGVVLAGGVAVLSEGVFEYEVVDGRALAVTLLRCVGTISRRSLATRPWPAGPDIATPDAQMIGETRWRLGVLTDVGEEDLLPAWERFALPLVVGTARGGGDLPATGPLLHLDLDGAQLSAVRRVNGRVEVRAWNPSDRERTLRVAGVERGLGAFEIGAVDLDR